MLDIKDGVKGLTASGFFPGSLNNEVVKQKVANSLASLSRRVSKLGPLMDIHSTSTPENVREECLLWLQKNQLNEIFCTIANRLCC